MLFFFRGKFEVIFYTPRRRRKGMVGKVKNCNFLTSKKSCRGPIFTF